jgi:hypothetical protein
MLNLILLYYVIIHIIYEINLQYIIYNVKRPFTGHDYYMR